MNNNGILHKAFRAWAEEHLGQGYSLTMDEGSYEHPVTRWAFVVWCARQKEIDALLSTIDELQGLLGYYEAEDYNRQQSY